MQSEEKKKSGIKVDYNEKMIRQQYEPMSPQEQPRRSPGQEGMNSSSPPFRIAQKNIPA